MLAVEKKRGQFCFFFPPSHCFPATDIFSKESQSWLCHQLSAICPWRTPLGINASG